MMQGNKQADEPLIVVIGRETGSGGRRLGKALAERLGLRYYDRGLLSECASRFGFSPDIFLAADERRPSPLRSFLTAQFGQGYSSPMGREEIYNAQSEVIRQLAAEEGGVFVGRSADYVLRHHPRMLSLFIHGPEEWRARETVARGDAKTTTEALAALRRRDAERRDFYNYFTGRKWGTAGNYDLCLDASRFTPDHLADVVQNLISLMENREGSR